MIEINQALNPDVAKLVPSSSDAPPSDTTAGDNVGPVNAKISYGCEKGNISPLSRLLLAGLHLARCAPASLTRALLARPSM
jgi:hypothetical protein